MTDYAQEQEMEIEALQAILMDDIKEIDSSEGGLSTTNRCFQIMLSPRDDDLDESNYTPVKLALIFSHTERYPDEPPLLNLKSVRGMKAEDLSVLKEKLEQEVAQSLGMAMVYTLVTSAKEWLSENFGHEVAVEESEETGLIPDSALTAPKEKKLTGRQWFESGRHAVKGAAAVAEGSEEEEEDIDLDDDFEDDEEDMLEHYLAERSDKLSEGSRKQTGSQTCYVRLCTSNAFQILIKQGEFDSSHVTRNRRC